jgi:hypothetical protein
MTLLGATIEADQMVFRPYGVGKTRATVEGYTRVAKFDFRVKKSRIFSLPLDRATQDWRCVSMASAKSRSIYGMSALLNLRPTITHKMGSDPVYTSQICIC